MLQKIRPAPTEPAALELHPLSLNGLLQDSLSRAMRPTLTTFDAVRQLDLLQFTVKAVQIPGKDNMGISVFSDHFTINITDSPTAGSHHFSLQ